MSSYSCFSGPEQHIPETIETKYMAISVDAAMGGYDGNLGSHQKTSMLTSRQMCQGLVRNDAQLLGWILFFLSFRQAS